MSIDLMYRAGGVRRWHTNADMAHVVDTVDAHSARVAKLILLLFPHRSRNLLVEALTHDDGEYGLGDLAGPAKAALSADTMAELNRVEGRAWAEIWGSETWLSGAENLMLKFADRLDAYIMVSRHAPHALTRDGWPEARDWLSDMAAQLIEVEEAEQELQRLLRGRT